MRQIEKTYKRGILKKLFIKLCRLFGYELIDQSNLELPVSGIKGSNLMSIPGVKSISLGSGETCVAEAAHGTLRRSSCRAGEADRRRVRYSEFAVRRPLGLAAGVAMTTSTAHPMLPTKFPPSPRAVTRWP